MSFEILRMPQTDDAIRTSLESVSEFLIAMYSEKELELHGEMNFLFDNFLFLWGEGGLFLLIKRNEVGNIVLCAVCSQYRDLWTARPRIEIQRVSMLTELDETTERQAMINYLKGVSSLLKFNQLYYNTHYADGSILREMVWNEKG